jgi:pimeloyl-ACP methyl ester carboxylesterase
VRPALASACRIFLGVLAGIAIGNPILLYFLQDRLLFHGEPINEPNRKLIRERYPAVSEVTLRAADGKNLHGWFQRTPQGGRAPLLIYFGGNEEDVSYLPARVDRVPGWSLLVLSHRGYGLSEGTPSEKALSADALAIYDEFSRHAEVDTARIAVMGRSLGSGLATFLAAHRPVRAAILVTPYDSIENVASERFWFAPISLILKHRFDSAALAPGISVPGLFLVAAEDEAIATKHSRRLFDSWAGPKKWREFRGEGHNTIGFHPLYWPAVGEFLASLT